MTHTQVIRVDRTRPEGFRLGRKTRKVTLTLHIVAAGIWLGLDAAFAVLLCTAIFTNDPNTQAVAYQALELVAIWPMLAAGLTSLVTGVTLGLGSRYGLVRYWWVAAKLAINVVFTLLIIFALRPGLYEVAERARQFAADHATDVPYVDLLGPLTVGPTLLLTATVLSVVKPWGRTRKPAADQSRPLAR